MTRGIGKIGLGVGLAALGLYLRFGQESADGGTVWPVVGLAFIVWGIVQLIRPGSRSSTHNRALQDPRLALQRLAASAVEAKLSALLPSTVDRGALLLTSMELVSRAALSNDIRPGLSPDAFVASVLSFVDGVHRMDPGFIEESIRRHTPKQRDLTTIIDRTVDLDNPDHSFLLLRIIEDATDLLEDEFERRLGADSTPQSIRLCAAYCAQAALDARTSSRVSTHGLRDLGRGILDTEVHHHGSLQNAISALSARRTAQ